MHRLPISPIYDLTTPDGCITSVQKIDQDALEVTVQIKDIPQEFVGFQIDKEKVFFNIKSTLAQLGLNGTGKQYYIDQKAQMATVLVEVRAIGPIAKKMLPFLTPGAYIGKLFAADDRRIVRNPEYLSRMFGRADRQGRSLLSLGGLAGTSDFILEKIEGRLVAFLTLKKGILRYDPYIEGFLPTLGKALHFPTMRMRTLLQINQVWDEEGVRIANKSDILLVQTLPLHIRTVFGRVVDDLLPNGYKHTTASVLEPDTRASGDVYELFGSSDQVLTDIPVEFYTLEPYREHVFFSDRDQLQNCLESPEIIFEAFKTIESKPFYSSATFVVKSDQLLHLKSEDWETCLLKKSEFPGLFHSTRQLIMVERYIEQQPSYPYLKAIEQGLITSQGVLLCQYLPTPLMKRMLLSPTINQCLKRIYFHEPSQSFGDYFSHEDRSLLLDLAKFGIPVFWADRSSGQILEYVPRGGTESGMFVPLAMIERFQKATAFGIYGSNLKEGDIEGHLSALFEGILNMRAHVSHPLMSQDTPLCIITGGGPGAMSIANKVAQQLGIISCANVVDFSAKSGTLVHEQEQNAYVDAKMTYRLDRLVERQAEFYLDFPILVMGGIGTDFEYSLEEVRRKLGSTGITPVLMIGDKSYWQQKITSRFHCNLAAGTIQGSEWVSNCFYSIQKPEQGLLIYQKFFEGTLPIGKKGPIYQDGFCNVADHFTK